MRRKLPPRDATASAHNTHHTSIEVVTKVVIGLIYIIDEVKDEVNFKPIQLHHLVGYKLSLSRCALWRLL